MRRGNAGMAFLGLSHSSLQPAQHQQLSLISGDATGHAAHLLHVRVFRSLAMLRRALCCFRRRRPAATAALHDLHMGCMQLRVRRQLPRRPPLAA
jgi:hypothetical protein